MTARLPLFISITTETCSQTQSCIGTLAVDSSPELTAFLRLQVLPHNKKRKQILEDPKNPCPSPRSNTHLLNFSLCFPAVWGLFKESLPQPLSLLSRVRVPRGPTWPTTSFHRQKLLFNPWLDFNMGFSLSVVNVSPTPPCLGVGYITLVVCFVCFLCASLTHSIFFPDLLFENYFHEYRRPQAFVLCRLLYKDPAVSLLHTDDFNYPPCSCWVPSLCSSDLSSEIQSHGSGDLLDMDGHFVDVFNAQAETLEG